MARWDCQASKLEPDLSSYATAMRCLKAYRNASDVVCRLQYVFQAILDWCMHVLQAMGCASLPFSALLSCDASSAKTSQDHDNVE